MSAFAQHFAFEFRNGLRNRSLLLLNYLFPLGFYAMMGVLMTSINPLFTPTMIPAMVVFVVLTSAILGLPSPLVEARDAGIFRSFRINGVPALSILIIPALTTAFHAVIAAAIITVTAKPLFGAPLPSHWPGFILVVLLSAFACAGLGALIGVVSATTRVTVLWSQLIFLPSMMLSGMMVPASMLPTMLARVAALLPATHAMRAFAALAYSQGTPTNPFPSLLALAAGGPLAFALAMALFTWDDRNARRRLPAAVALLILVPYAIGGVLLG